MSLELPSPGDLIFVEQSEWCALPAAERQRVCENTGWTTRGKEPFVASRSQVNSFWGAHHG